jgi:hypothetical protein
MIIKVFLVFFFFRVPATHFGFCGILWINFAQKFMEVGINLGVQGKHIKT